MKKFIALLLALLMLLSVAGIATAEEPRHIVIGVTWDIFYDSTHTDVYDNPGYTGDIAQDMMFERVKYVEDKWNVTFEFLNMTYSGSNPNICKHNTRCSTILQYIWIDTNVIILLIIVL